MPELPNEKKERFVKQYKLTDYDTSILVLDKDLSTYYEKVLEKTDLNPKTTANWIITELLSYANKSNTEVKNYPVSFEDLASLLTYIYEGLISNKQAKIIFEKMWNNGEKPQDIIEKEGIKQISDTMEINKLVDNVIKKHYKSVEEYLSGKDKLFGFFVGEVMKESKGKANPKIVNQLLKEKLRNDK
jgi:aspartyl-tRNA(Asn)/glutamyl-tRNA(Gln) amidotransferase subunit B